MQIEQKFKEFEELVTTGKNLLVKDHHLTQMVSIVILYIYDCIFSYLLKVFLAGKRAHGGAAEYARVDHCSLESSEATVASQEEHRGVFTRQHLFYNVPSN